MQINVFTYARKVEQYLEVKNRYGKAAAKGVQTKKDKEYLDKIERELQQLTSDVLTEMNADNSKLPF